MALHSAARTTVGMGSGLHQEVTTVIPFHASTAYFELYRREGLWKGQRLLLFGDGVGQEQTQRLRQLLQESAPPAEVYASERNEGPGLARYHGMQRVRTSFLQYCDEDDFLVDGLAAGAEAAALLSDPDTLCAVYPQVVAFDRHTHCGVHAIP